MSQKKLYLFFCAALLIVWCFLIFFENFKFFLVLLWSKKIREPFFSLKIKSLEKLLLSKSKILKRLDHRIAENLQNCNKKICNLYGTNVFQWLLRFQMNSVYLILSNNLRRKEPENLI